MNNRIPQRAGVRTDTITETQTETQAAPATREQELIGRMLKGDSVGNDHVLEFRGRSNPDMHAMLRHMEARALAHMMAIQAPAADPEPPVRINQQASDLIVNKLSRLKG